MARGHWTLEKILTVGVMGEITARKQIKLGAYFLHISTVYGTIQLRRTCFLPHKDILGVMEEPKDCGLPVLYRSWSLITLVLFQSACEDLVYSWQWMFSSSSACEER